MDLTVQTHVAQGPIAYIYLFVLLYICTYKIYMQGDKVRLLKCISGLFLGTIQIGKLLDNRKILRAFRKVFLLCGFISLFIYRRVLLF